MKHTDKEMLLSGIKKMALALPLLFLSPYLLTLSFINKENFMFYLGLTLGIIAGAAAIYLCFKGINTIINCQGRPLLLN